MTVSRFSSQAGTRVRSRVLVHSSQCGTNVPIGLYLHTPCRLCAVGRFRESLGFAIQISLCCARVRSRAHPPRLPPPPTSRAELRVTTRRRAYGMSAAVVFPYGLALPGRPGAGSALGLVSARPA